MFSLVRKPLTLLSRQHSFVESLLCLYHHNQLSGTGVGNDAGPPVLLGG